MAAAEKHQAFSFVCVHTKGGVGSEVADMGRVQLPPGGYERNYICLA